jgi:hypothetical protein
LIEKVEELLVRMQQKFANKKKIDLNRESAKFLLEDKYNPESVDG